MKKRFLNTLLTVSFLTTGLSTPVSAGPFDFLGGAKQESNSKSVDLNKLSQNGTKLIVTVGKATLSFSEAGVIILSALGKKEESEKLKALLEEVKKDPNNSEKLKVFISSDVTKKAFSELAKADLTSNKKMAASTQDLVNSFLKVGAGIILDTQAVNDAVNLVNEAKGVVELVKSDPMKYGVTAIGTVNSVIGSGQFISDNIPKQVDDIKKFSEKLVQYLKTNKIEVPSQDRLKQIANDLQKG
jgi:hypothetical protein